MANGVKFFPGSTTVYTPGTSTVATYSIPTGALVGGVLKAVVHGYGLTDIKLALHDGNNYVSADILRNTLADPTNSADIQVAVDVPGGYTLEITGNTP